MTSSPGSREFLARSLSRALAPWPIRAGIVVAIALLVLAGMNALHRGLLSPDPDRIWQEAEADLKAGRFAQAGAQLKRLEQLRSRTDLDWMLCAQVAVAQGRDQEALGALSRVSAVHPLAAQASLMAGRIERQCHQIRRAEALFREALVRDPRLIAAHKELIFIFGIQLRRRELDAEFKALAGLTALTHHDLFTWGLTHFTDWEPGIAKDLEEFVAADPDDRFSRLALAALLFDQPAMVSRVESVLDSLPSADPDAQALRVELRLSHGQLDEAVSLLAQAPDHHPQLARLRGRVAMMKGDRDVAIRYFHEALSGEPHDRVTLSELAKALVLKGDTKAAEVFIARAKRLDDVYNLINRVSKPNRENRSTDLSELGRACEAAGLLEEARGWYSLAIARDPSDSEAQGGLHRTRVAGS
jgi:tetratricopeptide (TPR) repeat protein